FAWVVANGALAQEAASQPPLESPTARSPDGKKLSRFSFVRTPWQDVLQWLAHNADLALYVGTLPTGSFTYSDDRLYTADEAIDRMNVFLIPQKFSLVRSGKLLAV